MHFLLTAFTGLLDRSVKTRLIIVAASWVICGALYVLFIPVGNGTILGIPVILLAWLFGYRGFFYAIVGLIPATAIYYSLRLGTILWPPSYVLFYIGGIGSGIAVGLVISFLRQLIDLLRTTQLQRLETQQSYEQQIQLNQLKDQLILHINHELRTPLTSVQGYLELLSIVGEDVSPTERALFIQKALASCDELLLLINAVLDVAQREGKKKDARIEELEVAQIVRDTLVLLDPLMLQNFTIQQEVPAGLMVWADQGHLREVLRNLISNACKYAPKHTIITISAVHLSSTSEEVCISVKDEGPGIPPTELPLLFQKFVRLQRDVSSAIPGTGLGLYICKQLVEEMKGHIWVESTGQEGEGSDFRFTLPAVSMKKSGVDEQQQGARDLLTQP